MNNVTPEQKQTLTKSLAVAGLLAIIIITAWLAIQIVQVMPSALSSLASIANSVYNYNPLQTKELTLSQNEQVISSGTDFTVTWPESDLAGSYVFNYECTPGVTIYLKTEEKMFADATCNQSYDLGTTTSVTITAFIPQDISTNVTYTVSFYRPNSTTPAVSASETVLIKNEPALAIDEDKEDNVVVATNTPDPKPEVAKPITSKPTTPTTGTPISTPIYIYEIPASNSNGSSDLAITYQGIGILSSNGTFTKTNTIKSGVVGAIQFTVHNIGNKTSDSWTYNVLFPNGKTYSSKNEKALLPNERAVITVQFPAVERGGAATVAVSAVTDRDTNKNNNVFNVTVPISN
jgi:hypothetical protein